MIGVTVFGIDGQNGDEHVFFQEERSGNKAKSVAYSRSIDNPKRHQSYSGSKLNESKGDDVTMRDIQVD